MRLGAGWRLATEMHRFVGPCGISSRKCIGACECLSACVWMASRLPAQMAGEMLPWVLWPSSAYAFLLRAAIACSRPMHFPGEPPYRPLALLALAPRAATARPRPAHTPHAPTPCTLLTLPGPNPHACVARP